MGFWSKLWGTSKAPLEGPAARPVSDAGSGNKAEVKFPTAAELGLSVERMSHMFERPPSFSFVLFEGDMTPHIPGLLDSCGYRILRIGKFAGRFAEAYAGASQVGPDTSIVLKAVFLAGWHTVLIDDGMIFGALYEGQLREFCKMHATNAVVATWERASETVMLTEFKAEGKVRSTWFCQGQEKEKLVPHSAIVESPDARGLLKAISEYINPGEIFGNISATAYELRK